MGQLTNLYVSESYQGLLKLTDSTTGVTGTLQYVQDGVGNNIPIQVSSTQIIITGSLIGTASYATQALSASYAPDTTNTGSLVTTSSFNAFTASIDGRVSSLEINSGSQQLEINQKLNTSSFNSYTSSNDSKVNSLIASTGSYATTSSLTSLSQSIAITDLAQNNRLNSIESITGSLATTSSLTSLSSSIAVTDLAQNNRLSSLETNSGSQQLQINQKLDSSSFNSYTSSNDGRVSSLESKTGSYATTGSNIFQGNQTITGSLFVTNEITALSASITYLKTIYQTSSIVYSSGSNIFGDEASDVQTLNGQVNIPLGNLNVTGATTSSLGFFGNLQGTASYATNALSASQAQNAVSSSFSQNTISGSFSNFAVSSSYSVNSDTSISSSYAQTASFASNGGVTQLLAGPNITISPLSGKGQVTISSTGTGTGSFNTATGSYGSFYDTTTQINPVANTANSMSFNETAITNGVAISGSISPFNTYIKTENAGVYNIQFSAQVDKTDGGTDSVDIWIRKNGTDLLDTATTVTLNNNNDASVAAWNWFVQSAANDYYQIIWASADTDMRLLAEVSSSVHPGIPSVIATANRIDQFLSNTGSFNGDFNGSFTGSLQGTASFATNALSASYAPGVSIPAGTVSGSQQIVDLGFATTGSNVFKGNQTISGSLLTNTLNDGLIKIVTEAQNSSSLAVPFGYISASAAISQSNLIFGSTTGIAGAGQLADNLTGSIVISGSNNIILSGNRANTLVTAGTYGYIGATNFVSTIPTITTSSILRPTVSNNNLNSQVSFAFTTSSLTAPSFATNNVLNSVTINHQSGSINYSNNINVGAVTSNANNIALPFLTTLQSNYFGGSTLTLNHLSSSITATNNIIGGAVFTVTNLVSSSVSTTANGLSFLNNLVVGSANGVWVSGSNATNRRFVSQNIIGGTSTAISSSVVSSESSGFGSSIVFGNNLIVNANQTQGTGGGAYFGRYNDTGSLSNSLDIVFAVGTGTAVGTRRTGLYVTSGSLVGVSGSLNVIGNSTFVGNSVTTGSLIASGSSADHSIIGARLFLSASLNASSSFDHNIVGSQINITGNTSMYGNSEFPLTVFGTINSKRLHFTSNPFNSNPSSNLAAIRYEGNNQTFYSTNYDTAQITTQSQVFQTVITGSGLVETGLQSNNMGSDYSLTLKNQSGTGSLITNANVIVTGSLNVNGSALITGSVQGNVLPLTVASNTASLNLNNGNFFVLALTGSQDIRIEPSNIKPGQTVNLKLNTTGSGTVSFPTSVLQQSGSAYVPTTTVGTDIITMVSFDNTNLYLANIKNLL